MTPSHVQRSDADVIEKLIVMDGHQFYVRLKLPGVPQRRFGPFPSQAAAVAFYDAAVGTPDHETNDGGRLLVDSTSSPLYR